MRKQIPRQDRPFRLPAVIAIAYLAFLSSNLIVYWSGWDTDWKLFVAVIIGYLVLVTYEIRHHDITPPMEFRSGAWVLAWLAGLAIISWIGSYPEPSHYAGNLGILGFGWAILVIAVFSALIMWMAVALRLPTARVEAHLQETPAEPPAAMVG
jgi:hypothetical protein